MPPFIKALNEFGPLIVFFVVYKFYGGIIPATMAIVVCSLISIAVIYYYERKIPAMPLFTAGILVVFGSITVFTGDSTFIKIKPTIIYLLFATILLFGLFYNKIFLKAVLEKAFTLSDEDWIRFSKRWAYFFIFLACLNEAIWRNFSEELWVKFKVFGFLPLTIAFLLSQRSFFSKNK